MAPTDRKLFHDQFVVESGGVLLQWIWVMSYRCYGTARPPRGMSDRVGRWHPSVRSKRKSVVSKLLLLEDAGCWLGLRCGELQWLSGSARFYSYCACFRHYTQVSVSFASVVHCVRTFIYEL